MPYQWQFEPLNNSRIGTGCQPCHCNKGGHHKSDCPLPEVHAATMVNNEGRTECHELEEVHGHHDAQGGVLKVWVPGASAYEHVGHGPAGISPKGDIWPCFSTYNVATCVPLAHL